MLMSNKNVFSLEAANNQPCYNGGPATLVCKAVIEETADSKTFIFEDAHSRSFDFKPGQYLTFRFEIDGEVWPRAYSICSTPTRPHNVQVTVKRVPDGKVSNWLNDTLAPGMSVEVDNLSGAFNYIDIDAKKPLFLSGGSGITPVMSMLQYITDVVDDTDAVFIHFARSPENIIFKDQLEFLSRRYENIEVHFVVDTCDEEDRFDGTVGLISSELIQELVPDLEERSIFMCGPEGFMRTARTIAREMNVIAIHEESFGEKIVLTDRSELGGEIFFSLSGKSSVCASSETVLDAALNAGLWIDSSCQQGICGNCKVLLTQGEVDMSDLGGLQDYERDQGYILACCSRPKGAISVDA